MEVQNYMIESSSKNKFNNSDAQLNRVNSGRERIIVGTAKTHTISHMTPISIISAQRNSVKY